MKIAVQTFGLKKEFEADFTGTIHALHDMGFEGIEPYVLFQKEQKKSTKNLWAFDTLKIAWQTMQELGMTIPSVHIGVGYGWMTMPTKTIIDNIRLIHDTYGICDFVISAPFGSTLLAKRWAKLAKTVSDAVSPFGCRILYHNHDDEFHPIRKGASKTNMDLFLECTSPEVLMQIDIGWAGLAGDERAIAKRHQEQIASIHLKDIYAQYWDGYTRKNMPAEAFAPIGEGKIQTKAILEMVERFSHFGGTIVIDQDQSSGPMLDALKVGIDNIQKMLREIESKGMKQ